jgi:hypothetical protein
MVTLLTGARVLLEISELIQLVMSVYKFAPISPRQLVPHGPWPTPPRHRPSGTPNAHLRRPWECSRRQPDRGAHLGSGILPPARLLLEQRQLAWPLPWPSRVMTGCRSCGNQRLIATAGRQRCGLLSWSWAWAARVCAMRRACMRRSMAWACFSLPRQV